MAKTESKAKTKVTNIQSLSYGDVFEGNENVNDLLKKLNLKNVLEITAHFINQVHFFYSDEQRQAYILGQWTSRLTIEIKEKLNSKIKEIKNSGAKINFFNNYAGMKLIQRALTIKSTVNKSEFDEHDELRLLKAYLLCNEEWMKKSDQIFEKIKDGNKKNRLAKVFFTNYVAITELVETKDLRFQVLKATYLFKFLESHEGLNQLLKTFLSERGLTSWRQYLNAILSLYTPPAEGGENSLPSIIKVTNKLTKKWLSTCTLNLKTFQEKEDFLGIRDKPVYQFSQDKFLILNRNFLIDKIYDGLKFDLYKSFSNNRIKLKDQNISNFLDFNSYLTTEFSETDIFYKTVERIFCRRRGIRKNGNELNTYFKNPPDYYIRERTNIMLFELKDIMIEKSVKHSFKFSKIWNEIEKKLIGSPSKLKGIRQLSSSIEQIMQSYFLKFDVFPPRRKKRKIYPIIVHNNPILDSPGLNMLLNNEFKKLVKSNNWYSIQNIVLINLDDLVHLTDVFQSKKMILRRLLDKFLVKTSTPDENAYVSFALYLRSYTSLSRAKNLTLGYEIKKITDEPAM